jgi:hypothetical protein
LGGAPLTLSPLLIITQNGNKKRERSKKSREVLTNIKLVLCFVRFIGGRRGERWGFGGFIFKSSIVA